MKHFLLFQIILTLFIYSKANKIHRKSHCVDFSPDLIYDKPRDLPSYGSDKIKLLEKKIDMDNLFELLLFKNGEGDSNFIKFDVKETCKEDGIPKNRMANTQNSDNSSNNKKSNSKNSSNNSDGNNIDSSNPNALNNYLSLNNVFYKIMDFKIATNEDRMYHSINGEKFNLEFIFSLHSVSKESQEKMKLSVFFKIDDEMAKIYTDGFFDDMVSKLECNDDCKNYYTKFNCQSLSNYINDKSNFVYYTYSSPNIYCGELKWIVLYDIFPISTKNYEKLLKIELGKENEKNILQVINIQNEDLDSEKLKVFKNKKIFSRQSSNLQNESTENLKNLERGESIPSVFYFSPNKEIEKMVTCKSNVLKEYYELREGDTCIDEKNKVEISAKANIKTTSNNDIYNSKSSNNSNNSGNSKNSNNSKNTQTSPISSTNSEESKNLNKENSSSNSSSNSDQSKSSSNSASSKINSNSHNSANNTSDTPNIQPNSNNKNVVVTVDNNSNKTDMYIINNNKIDKVDTNTNSSSNSPNEKNVVVVTNSKHHPKNSSVGNNSNNSNESINSQNSLGDSDNDSNGNNKKPNLNDKDMNKSNNSKSTNPKSNDSSVNHNSNNSVIKNSHNKNKNNDSNTANSNENPVNEKNELNKKIIENINNIKNNINNIQNSNNILNGSNNNIIMNKNSANNSKNNLSRNIRGIDNSNNNKNIRNNLNPSNNKSSNNIKSTFNSDHSKNINSISSNNYYHTHNNKDILDPYATKQSNIYNTNKSSSDLDVSNEGNNKNTISANSKHSSSNSLNNSNNTVLGTEIGVPPKEGGIFSKIPASMNKSITPPPHPPNNIKTPENYHNNKIDEYINNINSKIIKKKPFEPTSSHNTLNNGSSSNNSESNSTTECSDSSKNLKKSELGPMERLHNAIKNKEIPKIYKNQKVNYSKEGNLEINDILVIGDY